MNMRIKQIIANYLSHSASMAELDILEDYVNTPEGKIQFTNYVKTSYLVNYYLNDRDTAFEVDVLLQRIRRDKKKRNRSVFKYAVAAVFVGILLLGHFALDQFSGGGHEVQIPTTVDNVIEPGTNKSILTLSDGSDVILEKGTGYQSENVESDGEALVYGNPGSQGTEKAFHILTIPRGGQFSLTLADGTKVWLNSDSKLKYPVAFPSNKTRSIELVYGEAYFDVSPSDAHGGTKFRVINRSQEIEVLGTEFNVKAYNDDSMITTTLVEGKVEITVGKTSHILRPKEKARLNLKNNRMDISNANLADEISWKKGFFSFKSLPLEEITKVLDRWYDVQIIFSDAKLKPVQFSGIISRKLNIQEILDIIVSTNSINAYEVKDKQIFIK